MPGLRRLLGAFLVAALLVAQAGALQHQLWHQVSPGVAQDADARGEPLCAQHAALGDVLGAIGCAAASAAPAAPGFAAVAAALQAAYGNAPLNASSRDPPQRL